MALEQDRQFQVYGVRGASRVPGVLGAASYTGHTTDGQGTMRLPGPLKIGPSILLMDETAAKIGQKTPPMPIPRQNNTTMRVHVVTWELGASSPHTTDVAQGDVGDCPLASILAAMANTPGGSQRLSSAVKEHVANVVTDLSAVMQYLEDGADWADRPKGSIVSKRYFSVDLPGVKQEVSDVFYTDDGDRNWDLLYLGRQALRSDKDAKPMLWASVIEKAYAVQVAGYDKLSDIENPVVVWNALAGTDPKLAQVKDLNDSDITRFAQSAKQVPTIAATLADKAKVESESGGLLVGHHGYAVTGMAGKQIALYNPWGIPLNVSLDQFKKSFTTILYGPM